MKNHQLWKYYQACKQDTLCNHLNQAKIREWIKEYAPRIESLSKRMIELQEKYYQTKGFKNDQLDVVMEETETPDGKKIMRPKLQEGKTDADYQKEVSELMSRDIAMTNIKVVQGNGNGLKLIK